MAIVQFKHPLEGLREVETEDMRIKHLKKRLQAWCIAMWELKKVQPVHFFGVLLTYRGQKEIAPGQRQAPWAANDINEYVRAMNLEYKEHILGYCWVAEKHESGAIHYHVCWALDETVTKLKHADRNGWWSHGWSGTKTVRAPSLAYLGKYLQKETSKTGGQIAYHKGMRIFAAVIKKHVAEKLPELARFWYRLSAACSFVRSSILHIIGEMRMMQKVWLTGWRWEAMPGGGWYITYGTMFWYRQSAWRYAGNGSLDLDDSRGSGAYSYE